MKPLKWTVISLLATTPLLLSAQDIGKKWNSDANINRYNPSVDPTLKIRNAWIRPTIEGQDVTAAYMTIDSPVMARIISVYCPAVERVEFHETIKEASSAFKRMRPLRYPIPISPGLPIRLEPNGKHMMMIGLRQPLKAGDEIPCTFQLSSGLYNNTTNAAITVMLPVRLPPNQSPQPQGQPPSRPADTDSPHSNHDH